jgi:hypothetical protein
MKAKYHYFVSFMQQTEGTWGVSWRVISFNEKPSLSELAKAIEENNKEFKTCCIMNFKLLSSEELDLSELKIPKSASKLQKQNKIQGGSK